MRRRAPPTVHPSGRVAMHFAAASGHVRCVALLLAAAPECAALTDWHGVSPLQLACRHGHDEVLRLLQAAAASTLGAPTPAPSSSTRRPRSCAQCSATQSASTAPAGQRTCNPADA